MTEFLERARGTGATVLVGVCADFGENGPSYWPVLEALRPVFAVGGLPTIGGAQPAAGLPEVPTSSPGSGLGDQPASGPIPLFEMILRMLRRMVEQAPVVLIIEDIHWADRSTRDLLAFLLANLHDDQVMMVLTYRSEALGRRHSLQPLLAELRRGRRAEFIDLRPFTRKEMAAQLEAILGRPPEDELVELTWTRSDGNPFFAEELVAAIFDGYGNQLPPTLRHILTCRVDILPELARRVLRLVAVANEGVTFPLLATVGECGASDLVAALHQCVDHQLLTVDGDGRTYRFRHSLMRGARMRQLGLERTYGVALHAIAVNTLFRLGRWPEADHFLQQALAAKPTGSAAIDLCLARAKLSVGRGDFDAAHADLKAVETLATGGPGPRYEAPLMTLRAGLDLWLGHPERARESVNRGIMASIGGSDDVWLLAPLIWHGLRAEADIAELAWARHDTVALENARTIAAGLWRQVQSLAEDSGDAAPSIQKAIDAYLHLCQGEVGRAEGRPDPEVWGEAGRRWRDLHQPYPAAYADWRRAEAWLTERTRFPCDRGPAVRLSGGIAHGRAAFSTGA